MNDKLVQFLKKNWIYLAIVLVGLLLRVYRIATEQVWGEEVIYLNIASLQLSDLVFVRHWLIDHPPGFLVFIHFWKMVSEMAIWIRFPNLLLYLFSSLWVYRIAELLFNNRITKFVLVSVYAWLPYYVGIEWQAVPYVYAMTLFLASLYYVLQIIEGKLKRGEMWKLVLSLTGWLYVSYEAGYFGLLIAAFLMIGGLLKILDEKRVGMIFKPLTWVVVLFLPQAILLINRFPEMFKLSKVLIWFNEGVFQFILQLFNPHLNWEVSRYFLIIIFVVIGGIMFRTRKSGINGIFMFFLVVGSWAIFKFIGNGFFYIRHPRAYYYLVMSMVILFLMVIDKYWNNHKIKILFFSLGLFGCINFVIGMKNNHELLMARYAYRYLDINVPEAREKLGKIIGQQEKLGVTMSVVLDDNFLNANSYGGVALFDYYFKCDDLYGVREKECKSLMNRRYMGIFDEGNLSKVTSENMEYIGIFGANTPGRLFVNECSKYNLECWIWSTELDKFVKLNEQDQKDSDTIVTWFFYP